MPFIDLTQNINSKEVKGECTWTLINCQGEAGTKSRLMVLPKAAALPHLFFQHISTAFWSCWITAGQKESPAKCRTHSWRSQRTELLRDKRQWTWSRASQWKPGCSWQSALYSSTCEWLWSCALCVSAPGVIRRPIFYSVWKIKCGSRSRSWEEPVDKTLERPDCQFRGR